MSSSKPKPKHPSEQQLSDFLNGELEPRHQTIMERHLEKCSRCAGRLATLEGDTLSNRLRSVGTCYDKIANRADREIPEALQQHERYELIKVIGKGGMGDVYHARQRSMDRPVAIKILRKDLFENDRAVARFHNEIKVAARLNHPNIVHSYDADISHGLNILVMELVDGKKLSDQVFENGPLRENEAIQIAQQIACGLGYAAEQGMIHRDIKPQNIMVLPDGKVKITDFGLAKFVLDNAEDPDGSLTMEGEIFGTPDYISPEQIRNSSDTDARSDIYALGCTIYFMLTGRPPFAATSVGEKLAGHLERKATSLDELRPDVGPQLTAAVDKMMEKAPGNRFQTYSDVTQALEEALCTPSFLMENKVQMAGQAVSDFNSPTAPDLHATAPSSKNRIGTKNSLSRRVLLGAFACSLPLVVAGLISGWLPNPFSSDSKPGNGKIKFAIVVPARNAYYPEIQELHNRLSEFDDVEFEFVAESVGRVRFFRYMPEKEPKEVFVNRTLEQIETSEVDAVIFTGGWDGDSSESTRYAFDEDLNLHAKEFIEALLADGKPIGSICGGTVVLANAGVLQGKKVANCRYISDEIKSRSGATWSKPLTNDKHAETIRDGMIVTGGNSINGPEIARLMTSMARERRQKN